MTAIVVALTAWVQSTWPNEWWLPGAVILLGAIAKLAELYLAPADPNRLMTPKPLPSKTARFFLGG